MSLGALSQRLIFPISFPRIADRLFPFATTLRERLLAFRSMDSSSAQRQALSRLSHAGSKKVLARADSVQVWQLSPLFFQARTD